MNSTVNEPKAAILDPQLSNGIAPEVGGEWRGSAV
jgi:hypothetical protein